MKKSEHVLTPVIAVAMLVGLPLLGVASAGANVGQYLEFPPLTRYVVHPPFSWLAFAVVATGTAVLILPLAAALWRGRRRVRGTAVEAERHPFPWWGWAAVALGALAWVLAWTRFEWFEPLQKHTFTPLWLSYIFVGNALCVRRTGRCPLLDNPPRFLLLFPCSALFWWFFEYLNRFVQNWYYLGVGHFRPGQYVAFATLAFSTVLPAVCTTCHVLLSFPGMNRGLTQGPRLALKCRRRIAWTALGCAGVGLALIGRLPAVLFPLLWVSPLLILTALQTLQGRSNLFTPLRHGDLRPLVIPALAALICGWFWEMWNIYSLAKWEYVIPFVDRFHIFEMPLLGYAGYLPFGLECAVVTAAVASPLLSWNSPARETPQAQED